MIDRIVQAEVRYRHTTFIRVISRTLVLLFPLVLVGSFAKVISATLINPDGYLYNLLGMDLWTNSIALRVIQNCLTATNAVTLGLIGLLASYGAAKFTAQHYQRDFQAAGLTGLVTMMVIAYQFNRGGIPVSFEWRLFGYKFLLIDLLVGFIVGQFFRWLGTAYEENPDHVIVVRQRSYDALKPILISLCFGLVIDLGMNIASAYSVFSGINASLQSQLQGSATVLMKSLLALLSTFLGWCGLQGAFTMDWQNESAQMAANLAYVLSHKSNWHVPYPYLSSAIYNVYCRFGGDGIILALVIALLIVDRSRATKQLVSWSLVPLCFNIDQVAMFGLPVILNPLYLLPMLVIPLINLGLALLAIYLKLLPPIAFVILSGTPGPLMSFMGTAGYPGALVFSLVLLLADVLLYLPFVRMVLAVEKRVRQIDRQEVHS